jgi:hypothetical protein
MILIVAAVVASLLVPGSIAAAAEPSVMRVAVVPSAGQMSLVIEMSDEARHVSTQQSTPTLLLLEAGPIAMPLKRQVLDAPSGLPLVERVLIDAASTAGNEHVLRLGITMKKPTPSTVRVLGRRIYVDFMVMDASMPAESGKATTAPVAPPPVETAVATGKGRVPAKAAVYQQVVKDATSRFEEIEPFLLSATTARVPNPAVLNAVADAITSVQQSLRGAPVPPGSGPPFQLLVSAVSLAAEAVSADFRGDRASKAQQSMSIFAAAKTQIR